MSRYLEGTLTAFGQEVHGSCFWQNLPGFRPEPASWWIFPGEVSIGLPQPSLRMLQMLFPQDPADSFFRCMEVDRPMVFSVNRRGPFPEVSTGRAKAALVHVPGGHFMVYCSPGLVDEDEPFFPVSTFPSFLFHLSLCAGFLPVEAVWNARAREVVFPGWTTKHLAWLGRHDMWLPVRPSPEGLIVDGEWVMKPSPPDQFPLEISVEIGRIRLRGSELSALTQGAVIPLHGAFGQQVQLLYDNRLLARGELVLAGGELAIRLLNDVTGLETVPDR